MQNFRNAEKRVVVPAAICYNAGMENGAAPERPHRSADQKPQARAAQPRAKSAGGKSPSGQGKRKTATTAHKGKKRRLTKKQRRQRRILLLAALFLAFSVLVLVGSVLLVTRCTGGCEGRPGPVFGANASPSPTPEPITDRTVIRQSVSVNGISLRGMTVGNARLSMQNRLDEQMRQLGITVAYDSYSMILTEDKVGLSYDEDALENVLIEAASATGKAELSVPFRYSDELLRTALQELNAQLPNHAENAKCEVLYKENVIGGRSYFKPYFSYTEGVNGMAVDTEDVVRQVEDALNAGIFSAEIRPEVTISAPPLTVADYKKKTTLLGSMVTTYYYTGTSSTDEDLKLNRENRDFNISKAVEKMNVIQLAPGKTFSYNNATGKRTEKNGWALANAIYKSSHRPEAGGGVCQLSSTMYNALLLANIKIVSRRAHTMQIDYLDPGWDATVDDGHIDFKFQNNTDSTLYVFCYITKNSGSPRKKDIHVEVYGRAFPDGVTYKKRSEIVEVLPFGEETIKDKTMYVSDKPVVERQGTDGLVVNTFIDKYVNGQFSKTVYETQTTYEAISKQVRVGTKADPTNDGGTE